MDKKRIDEIKEKAFEIRCLTINEIASFGSGHIGGAMSISDLLALLYFDVMNVDPKNPGKEDRDRLVVSKGHAGPAVYASLALKGYFPKEMLSTLNQGGTSLPSHCDMLKTPGVDFTAGSLGQGFSAAAGIACGNRVKGVDAWTFSIIGDGESQEGQIWEAAEFAGAQKLDRLIAFEDLNGQQLDGYTKDIIPEEAEAVASRWTSFGWDTEIVDGHDVEALKNAIERAKGIKANHSMPIKKEDAEKAISALKEREGR